MQNRKLTPNRVTITNIKNTIKQINYMILISKYRFLWQLELLQCPFTRAFSNEVGADVLVGEKEFKIEL